MRSGKEHVCAHRRADLSTHRGTRKDERGAAAVEFALILPVFLALVFGIISYGYMLSYRQSLSQSAAEGARAFAVTPPGAARTPSARAIEALNESLSSYDIRCVPPRLVHDSSNIGDCSVTTAACTQGGTGTCVTVNLAHRYEDHPLIPSFPGLGTITLPEELRYTAVLEVDS